MRSKRRTDPSRGFTRTRNPGLYRKAPSKSSPCAKTKTTPAPTQLVQTLPDPAYQEKSSSVSLRTSSDMSHPLGARLPIA